MGPLCPCWTLPYICGVHRCGWAEAICLGLRSLGSGGRSLSTSRLPAHRISSDTKEGHIWRRSEGTPSGGLGWGKTWQGAYFLCLLMPSRRAVSLAQCPRDRAKLSSVGSAKEGRPARFPESHQRKERRVGKKVGLIPSFRGPRNLQSQVSPRPGFLK